jgi:hypothetical protein
MMSRIQAFLFPKEHYRKVDVNNFIRKNKIVPLKAIHTTKYYHRLRLINPSSKYSYRTITIDPKTGLKAVIMF